MVTLSIRNCLNKDGCFVSDDKFTSLFNGKVNSEEIVSVDTDSRHTIRDTSNGDTVTSVLVVNGGRNGVHIISTEKECLAAESRSEVECRVEITFRG